MEALNDTLLYTLDKCFRTYHQFAQKNVRAAGHDITIDQWLILKSLMENPNITQNDLGKILFKDNASITRMIQLLVTSGYLNREVHVIDRRRTNLSLTEKGTKATTEINDIAIKNRAQALTGIDNENIAMMKQMMKQIMQNCNEK